MRPRRMHLQGYTRPPSSTRATDQRTLGDTRLKSGEGERVRPSNDRVVTSSGTPGVTSASMLPSSTSGGSPAVWLPLRERSPEVVDGEGMGVGRCSEGAEVRCTSLASSADVVPGSSPTEARLLCEETPRDMLLVSLGIGVGR